MKHDTIVDHVRFLRSREEAMVNQTFANLSITDRQTKLRIALRNKTCDALTEDELKAIMENVNLGRQYVICPCFDICGFFQKLPRSGTLASFLIGKEKMPHTNLQLLLYTAMSTQEAITVVVDTKREKSELHILLPRDRKLKGELS